MSSRPRSPHAPPRLLIGATLLFWGGVTAHPVIGLICALLVEARSWTDLRWHFGERGFVRAWALSVLLAVLTMAWFWLQGTSEILLFDFLTWMPVYLSPVILAQNYALQQSMPLNTFSFIARRKMLIDRAAGRIVHPVQIHLGYPYLSLVLVAAALSHINQLVFFAALILIAASALVFSSPISGQRPVGMAMALTLVVVLGGVGSMGLFTIWESLKGGLQLPYTVSTSGDRSKTAIGSIGEIKLSKRLIWRIRDLNPEGPKLFREAVYNHYAPGQWWHKPVADLEPKDDGDKPSELLKREDDYEDLWFRDLPDGARQHAFETDEFDRDPKLRKRLQIIGKAQTKSPLPLPDSTQRLSGLRTTKGGVTSNSLGTVRLENPDHGVVSFEVFYEGEALYENPPHEILDVQVPDHEKVPGRRDRDGTLVERADFEGVTAVCSELGLKDLSTREAMQVLKAWFFSKFTYSLSKPGHRTGNKSVVAKFLVNDLKGHCEYFATAAVLLLREAGIPTRYCVGFSAQEKRGSDEWLLRGSDAHAWCRVWVGNRWINFDPTPPADLFHEGSDIPWSRKVLDFWQLKREDFLIWRTSPGNTSLVNWVMTGVALLLFGCVSVRLWLSRTRRGPAGNKLGPLGREAIVTPLHALVKPAERWLGSRNESESFTKWILGLVHQIPTAELALRRAVSYHWKARFDPIGLEPAEEGEFEKLCGELKAHLRERQRDPAGQ